MWGGLACIQGTAARNKSTRQVLLEINVCILLFLFYSKMTEIFGYQIAMECSILGMIVYQIQGCAQPSLLSGCQAKML